MESFFLKLALFAVLIALFIGAVWLAHVKPEWFDDEGHPRS